MAKQMKPLVRGGGYYPSKNLTPLVYPGGYTTIAIKEDEDSDRTSNKVGKGQADYMKLKS